jgi:hypothetical protein
LSGRRDSYPDVSNDSVRELGVGRWELTLVST